MKNQKINVAKYTEFTELVDIKRLNFIADSIQEHCSPGARILDVGCGNGNIARGIGSLGYEVVGIDFSEDAIRYAKSKTPCQMYRFEFAVPKKLQQLSISMQLFAAKY
ncbi:MAG TPA: methyltransferase domain-containing protein [Bacteroidia bacterium]|nr:methyltransferase domain-containing protein [Bacteroidia bacterium]